MRGELGICPRETLDKGCGGEHAHKVPSSSSTQASSFHGDLEELTGKNTNVDIMSARFNQHTEVRRQCLLVYSFRFILIHSNIIKSLEVCW